MAKEYKTFNIESIKHLTKKIVDKIPINVSQLNNDLKFVVEEKIHEELEKKSDKETTYTKAETDKKIKEAQLSGQVDLSNYATKEEINLKADKTELHQHSNKTVLDTITQDKLNKIDKSIIFEDSVIGNANDWITNGYKKTSNNTTNLPPQCNGSWDKWGILFFAKENTNTGIQTFIPIDGTQRGRMFIRTRLNNTWGDWNLLSTFDGNYNNLTNKPNIPSKTSQLQNDSNFLTSIPGEYITESELEGKKYLTSKDIEGKADKETVNAELEKKATKEEMNRDLEAKSDKETTYTKEQTDSQIDEKIKQAQLSGQVDLSNYVTKNELKLKADKTELEGKANKEHTHEQYLTQAAISGKADKTELEKYATKEELNTKADSNHTHNTDSITGLNEKLETYATKEELENKADKEHTHEGYLTQDDISNKADKSELHQHSNINILNDLKIKFWTGTKDEYDGVTSKDPNTLYIIK